MEVNINQLMEMTGKGFRTIKSALKSLKPVREDGRAAYYEAKDALRLIYGISDLDHETLLLERARRKKAELEVAKMSGELIPLVVLIREVEREYTVIRSQYRSLSSKLAKSLAITTNPAEVQARLDEAINEILNELSADAVFAGKKRNLEDANGTAEVSDEGAETDSETDAS